MNRLDFEIIRNVIAAPKGTSVILDVPMILDVGCENGELLKFLNKGRKIDGRFCHDWENKEDPKWIKFFITKALQLILAGSPSGSAVASTVKN